MTEERIMIELEDKLHGAAKTAIIGFYDGKGTMVQKCRGENIEPAPPKNWKPFCYDCYDDEGNQHDGCVEADRKSLDDQAGPCQFCIYR